MGRSELGLQWGRVTDVLDRRLAAVIYMLTKSQRRTLYRRPLACSLPLPKPGPKTPALPSPERLCREPAGTQGPDPESQAPWDYASGPTDQC